MAYFLFTSPKAPKPIYANSEAVPLPVAQGPWNGVPIPDLPERCARMMMLRLIQDHGWSYLVDGDGS